MLTDNQYLQISRVLARKLNADETYNWWCRKNKALNNTAPVNHDQFKELMSLARAEIKTL